MQFVLISSSQVLEDQIYRCLQKASELKANSIVFPTVGCGRLHYDPLEVVWCFKRAIKKHASDDICCVSKVCCWFSFLCTVLSKVLLGHNNHSNNSGYNVRFSMKMFKSSCYRFKACAISFTPYYLSCINEYLTTDSGGYN